MGNINNTITYKSVGTGAVIADLALMNRETTRLGQSSASAGRQFGAQAHGLGGLVAAYAGAAATIFALQQAFSALNKAAVTENIIEGTRTLAREIGASSDVILAKIKDITKGQLSLSESARAANIGLSAGFGQEQLEGIFTIASKASRALGRTLTDAVERLTRGAAKLEPELLDELGIFTRIDPAVQKYASSLNRSVSSLTQFERRQAFVNEIISEGNRKFSSINTSVPTAQQSLEKLSATLLDVALSVGTFFANLVKGPVDFLSSNISNTMALFLLLFSLVSKKSKELATGFFAAQAAKKELAGFSRAETLLSKTPSATSGVTGLQAFRSQTADIFAGTDFKNAISKSDSEGKAIRTLIQKAKDQELSIRELVTLKENLNKSLVALESKTAIKKLELGALPLITKGDITSKDVKALKDLEDIKDQRKLLGQTFIDLGKVAKDNQDILSKTVSIQESAQQAAQKLFGKFNFSQIAKSFSATDEGKLFREQITKAKEGKASIEELFNIRQKLSEKTTAATVAGQTYLGKFVTALNIELVDAQKLLTVQQNISKILSDANIKDKNIQKLIQNSISSGGAINLTEINAIKSAIAGQITTITGDIAKQRIALQRSGIDPNKITAEKLTPENIKALESFRAQEAEAAKLRTTLTALEKQYETLPEKIKNAIVSSGNFGKAIVGFGQGITFAIGGIFKFIQYLSILQISLDVISKVFGFGQIDILDQISKLIASIGREFKNATESARGLFYGIGGKELISDLQKIGLSITDIDIKLQKFSETFATIGLKARDIRVFQEGPGIIFEKQAERIRRGTIAENQKQAKERFTAEKYIEQQLEKQKTAATKKLTESTTAESRKDALATLRVLEEATKIAKIGGFEFLGVLFDLKEKTNLTMDDIGEAIKNGTIKIDKETGILSLVLKDSNEKLLGNRKSLFKLPTISLAGLSVNIDKAFAAFKAGQGDSEVFAKTLIGLQNNLKSTLNEYKLYGLAEDEALDRQKERVNNFSRLVGALKNQEETLKQIRTIFGKDITQAETGFVSGLVGATGKLATSVDEIDLNKIKVLDLFISRAKNVEIFDAESAKIAETGEAAIKAMAGAYLEAYKNAIQLKEAEEKRLLTLQQQLTTIQSQNAVQNLQNQVTLIQTQSSNLEKSYSIQAQITTEQGKQRVLALQILLARAQAGAKLLEQLQQIRNLTQEVYEIEVKTYQIRLLSLYDQTIIKLEAFKSILSDFGLASEGKIIDLTRKIEATKAESQLKQLKIEEGLIEQRGKFDRERIQKEFEILLAQQAGIAIQKLIALEEFENKKKLLALEQIQFEAKYQNDLKVFELQKQLIDRQEKSALLQAEIQNKQATLEIEAAKRRLYSLVAQELIFTNHIKGIAEVLTKDLVARGLFLQGEKISITPNTERDSQLNILYQNIRNLLNLSEKSVKENYDTNTKGIKDNAEAQRKNLSEQEQGLKTQTDQQRELFNEKMRTFELELKAAIAQAEASGINVEAQRKILALQQQVNAANVTQKLAENKGKQEQILLEEQLRQQRANLDKNMLFKTYTDFIKNINTLIADGAEKISKEFFDTGTISIKNLQEIAYSFLDNIRKNVTENLIVKPLQGLASDALGQLGLEIFGIGKPDGSSPTAALWTRDANNPLGIPSGMKGLLDKTGINPEEGFFGKIGTFFSDLFSKLKDVFSDIGNFLGRVLSSIGGGIGDAASGLFSFLGFSSGGSVPRFSAGGLMKRYASGGQRDSILGMLEPGEFILRKDAVNRMGLSNAQALNRGNPSTTLGKTEVHLHNNGTPQQTDGDPKIRFDGEKMVIDIILRDIGSNGPIRQTIRGLRS